jgi:hypothetical protein
MEHLHWSDMAIMAGGLTTLALTLMAIWPFNIKW